eukprot:TRINITY_DN8203_c0_g1_i4.p1 TRINITY_DN8203_c0_g1~~TRINITY_DN8203_c0_g1_i4.p1  ORF type:complete len:658 (+),score=75.34 TRINITY_DN8203_c0_g1_i4:188-1975(+)
MAVVVLNFILVVCETELRANNKDTSVAVYLGIFFLVLYCLEMSARIFVDRLSYFAEISNSFDFAIVALDVCSELTLLLDLKWKPQTAWLRLFRVMRILRAIRRVQSFHELWLMLHGLTSAVKAMVWACILIMIVLLVWSLIAIEWLKPLTSRLADADAFDGCTACTGAFDTITRSTFTWFLLIFAGDLWSQLVPPIVTEAPLSAGVFFSAFAIVYLGLMNLILTVIVEKAAAARVENEIFKADEKKVEFESAKKKFRRLCAMMDEDDSGLLTLDELKQGYAEGGEFATALKAMDVAGDDLETVFHIFDTDQSGQVTFDEFVEQLHKFKTQEERTVLVFVKHYVAELHKKVSQLEGKFDAHSLIPNSPAGRMNDAVDINWRLAQCRSEMDSMSKCHYCGDSLGLLGKRSTSASRRFSEKEEACNTNGQPELGRTSGRVRSQPSSISVETESAVALGEISSIIDDGVAIELRRLLERMDQAMSILVRDNALQQAKQADCISSIELAIQRLPRGYLETKTQTDMETDTTAMKQLDRDHSPCSKPVSAALPQVPVSLSGPLMVAPSPSLQSATASHSEPVGQLGVCTKESAGKKTNVIL